MSAHASACLAMARISVDVPDLHGLETVSNGDCPTGCDASGDESPSIIDKVSLPPSSLDTCSKQPSHPGATYPVVVDIVAIDMKAQGSLRGRVSRRVLNDR
jgi:hypothetical protein